jgi:hypothetical protein
MIYVITETVGEYDSCEMIVVGVVRGKSPVEDHVDAYGKHISHLNKSRRGRARVKGTREDFIRWLVEYKGYKPIAHAVSTIW